MLPGASPSRPSASATVTKDDGDVSVVVNPSRLSICVVDLDDTALKVTVVALDGLAMSPPVQVITAVVPVGTVPPPAVIVRVVAVIPLEPIALEAPVVVHTVDPSASHMPDDAVSVRVSPLTSVSVTPTWKVIDAGTSFATRLDGDADTHVSAVLAAISIVAVAALPVDAEEESSTVNVTVVIVDATGFVARPPVHVIAVIATALIPPAPTVRVRMSWFPLIALPPTAIAVLTPVTKHNGAATPTAQSE